MKLGEHKGRKWFVNGSIENLEGTVLTKSEYVTFLALLSDLNATISDDKFGYIYRALMVEIPESHLGPKL